MIQLGLKGFRGFGDWTFLDLKNISFLTGRNSSGKSSFIKIWHFLAQALEHVESLEDLKMLSIPIQKEDTFSLEDSRFEVSFPLHNPFYRNYYCVLKCKVEKLVFSIEKVDFVNGLSSTLLQLESEYGTVINLPKLYEEYNLFARLFNLEIEKVSSDSKDDKESIRKNRLEALVDYLNKYKEILALDIKVEHEPSDNLKSILFEVAILNFDLILPYYLTSCWFEKELNESYSPSLQNYSFYEIQSVFGAEDEKQYSSIFKGGFIKGKFRLFKNTDFQQRVRDFIQKESKLYESRFKPFTNLVKKYFPERGKQYALSLVEKDLLDLLHHFPIFYPGTKSAPYKSDKSIPLYDFFHTLPEEVYTVFFDRFGNKFPDKGIQKNPSGLHPEENVLYEYTEALFQSLEAIIPEAASLLQATIKLWEESMIRQIGKITNSLFLKTIPPAINRTVNLYQAHSFLSKELRAFHYLEEKQRNLVNQRLNQALREADICHEVIFNFTEGYSQVYLVKGNRQIPLIDEGSGISQILKILLAILIEQIAVIEALNNPYQSRGNKKGQLIFIEEPESNLHPDLQSQLAEALTELVKSLDCILIIETHSEYLIRKVQYLIAKKELPAKDVVIHYFENKYTDKKHWSIDVISINLNDKGHLSKKVGEGFLDEADRLKIELGRIQRQRSKS